MVTLRADHPVSAMTNPGYMDVMWKILVTKLIATAIMQVLGMLMVKNHEIRNLMEERLEVR